MAEGPTREDTEKRLEAIFSSALEGEELEKMIDSIPKRIEKFEGKWGGLIGWAEKKYGVPDDSEGEPEAEAEEPDGESEEDPEGLDWEEPEGTDPESSTESEESDTAKDIESTLELIQSGESEAALASLKAMISKDGANPEAWRGMAAYFDSVGMNGRSKACEEKAETLS